MTAATPGPPAGRSWSIREVAAAFGLPVSTLRYYDVIGLAPASHRRGRVRHYDRADLHRLAYARLWHADGALSIERTVEIIGSTGAAHRNDVIDRCRRDLAARIALLAEAQEMLGHLTRCRYDDHTSCPVVRAYLDERVTRALTERRDPPRDEPVHAAMRRVKAGLPGAADG